MIRYNLLALEIFAILVSYIVLMLPVAMATNVNIMFNGVVQETVEYSQGNIVNKQVSIKHDPSDITWTNVKVLVDINSASLAHSIQKIYLYKCRTLYPSDCIRSVPQEFDNWIDTELLWNDISEKEGPGLYPQNANLLFLVKIEDVNQQSGWLGFWTHIRRDNYNIFTVYEDQIDEIDVYATSLNFIQPIKNYIQNKLMVPFRWATKVVFKGSSKLYALGASENEIEKPTFSSAISTSSEISSINKDYYFVLPETSSGIAHPITLNLNPSFECGDEECEPYLGESDLNCCFDCPCAAGYYCDANVSEPTKGECKSEGDISLEIVSAKADTVTDCSDQFEAEVSMRIRNPPSSMVEDIEALLTIGEETYSVDCPGSGGSYTCSVELEPGVACGSGSYTISPVSLDVTIEYEDGQNEKVKELSADFSGIRVGYECECEEGEYCDTGTGECESEDAITLGVTSLTDYLSGYQDGDTIQLTAKIFNPPTGLSVVSTSARMELEQGTVNPGTPSCSGPSADYEYSCTIPFQIAGYDPQNAYTFDPNTLRFVITYNDGPTAKTMTLEADFGPISIPSQDCGNGKCDPIESEATCCLDCECSGDDYCDAVKGCQSISGTTLSVDSVSSTVFHDCRESHLLEIGVSINNPPTDMDVDYFQYMMGGAAKGWNLDCDEVAIGRYSCQITIPELETEGCSLPHYTVGPNSMEFGISFPDGTGTRTSTVTGSFGDILVVPVYHCGDEECESDLNENSQNCCIDCPCDAGLFCDYHPDLNPNGTCIDKSNIELIIDSPTSPVHFTSCEISNDITIKAHVENPPSSMRSEYYYAELGGENAELIWCDEITPYRGANSTYNCSLTVPSITMCSLGQKYLYENNSLSVLISYDNGPDATETMTLTADLPTIEITQGVRTLYDITQEMLMQLRLRLQRTIDIARDLFDWYKDCMEMAEMMGYITIMATIASAVFGAVQMGRGKMSGKDFGSLVGGVANAGTSIMEAWMNFCKLISEMYKLDIKIQELEMEMIKMEFCMEFTQHMFDTGKCEGHEEQCFNKLVGCVNFKDINNWMDDISDIMDDAAKDADKMGDAWEEFGEAMEDIGEGLDVDGGRVIFQTYCNTDPREECCNKYLKSITTEDKKKTYNCGESYVKIRIEKIDCKFPVVHKNDALLCFGNDCNNYKLELISISSSTTWEFDLYCFDDAEEYSSAKAKGKMSKYRVHDTSYPMKILIDKNNDCDCIDEGEGNVGNGNGNGGVSSVCNLNSGDEIILVLSNDLSLVSELSSSSTLICKMPQYTTAQYIEKQSYGSKMYIKIKVISSGEPACEGKTGWTWEGPQSGCYWGKSI